MKTKMRNENPAVEAQFELKYCERCGGLWLRPAGGGQIYCKSCGLEMAKLPTVSRGEGSLMPEEGLWDGDEGFDECPDLKATGGAA